jgi:hypothetical protein
MTITNKPRWALAAAAAIVVGATGTALANDDRSGSARDRLDAINLQDRVGVTAPPMSTTAAFQAVPSFQVVPSWVQQLDDTGGSPDAVQGALAGDTTDSPDSVQAAVAADTNDSPDAVRGGFVDAVDAGTFDSVSAT